MYVFNTCSLQEQIIVLSRDTFPLEQRLYGHSDRSLNAGKSTWFVTGAGACLAGGPQICHRCVHWSGARLAMVLWRGRPLGHDTGYGLTELRHLSFPRSMPSCWQPWASYIYGPCLCVLACWYSGQVTISEGNVRTNMFDNLKCHPSIVNSRSLPLNQGWVRTSRPLFGAQRGKGISCTSLFVAAYARLQDYLGNALTHDPKNAKTILAAGSIIQELELLLTKYFALLWTISRKDHSDMDVALIKYRVAAVHTPNSAQLWNKPDTQLWGCQVI